MKGFLFLLFTVSLLIMIQVRAAPQSPRHHHPGLPISAQHGGEGMQAPGHPAFFHRSRGSSRGTMGSGGLTPSLPVLLVGISPLEGCP